MATRVLITVDTELLWRHYAAGHSWEENLARSYEPAGVGVPYQLELLARHGLKAVFFVDPMPALLYGIEPVRRMVEPILAAGQEVQLHLHSSWQDLADGREDPRYELTRFDAEEQRQLVGTAKRLLIEAGAPPPTAFRAGGFAANADTLDALAEHGLRWDSSHNGSCHPFLSALPLDPQLIDPAPCRGVFEAPVGQIGARGGGLRHLQICAVSSRELEAALLHACLHKHPMVTLVSHSFELATRDGRRRNGTVAGRFSRLCAMLEKHRELLPTAHFNELTELPEAAGARPLPYRSVLTTHRAAEQLWSEARYERPGPTLTAAYGTAVAGLEVLVPILAR
jgi:hypothetical protein